MPCNQIVIKQIQAADKAASTSNNTIPLLANPLASTQEQTARAQLSKIIGVQNLDFPNSVCLVFLLKNRKFQPQESSEAVFSTGQPFSNSYQEMAFIIDRHAVQMDKRKSYDWWLRQTLKWIDENARLPIERPDRLDMKAEKNVLFWLQSQKVMIAKRTRRGAGNVIICNREGLEQLNLHKKPNSDLIKTTFKDVIVLDQGDVPFAYMGYSGNNPYDQSMALMVNSQKKTGIVHQENAADYWIKLV